MLSYLHVACPHFGKSRVFWSLLNCSCGFWFSFFNRVQQGRMAAESVVARRFNSCVKPLPRFQNRPDRCGRYPQPCSVFSYPMPRFLDDPTDQSKNRTNHSRTSRVRLLNPLTGAFLNRANQRRGTTRRRLEVQCTRSSPSRGESKRALWARAPFLSLQTSWNESVLRHGPAAAHRTAAEHRCCRRPGA